MFKGVQEEDTFETTGWEDDDAALAVNLFEKQIKNRRPAIFAASSLPMTFRKKWVPSSSISRWPILKTESVIFPWKS